MISKINKIANNIKVKLTSNINFTEFSKKISNKPLDNDIIEISATTSETIIDNLDCNEKENTNQLNLVI